jgi:Pol polyprotein
MVHGFSYNLSTVATGHGIVQLKSHYGRQIHQIVLQNVLHIPAACMNLISRIQLDKVGVKSSLGNSLIALRVNGKTIVEEKIVKDMYCLHLKIIWPATPLAS